MGKEIVDDASRRKLFAAVLTADEFTPAAALVKADIAARSHRGRVLKENDDHYLVLRLGRYEETLFTSLITLDVPRRFDEWAYAAAVADGIGANGAGAFAARLAIATLADLELRFGQWRMRVDPDTASEILDQSRWLYDRAHEAVVRWYRKHEQVGRMAAALTGVYSAGDDLFVAHVGHSRCYLFRNGLLTQMTRDQTVRQRLATAPQPTPVERALDDAQHKLTNAIGMDAGGPGVLVEHFRLADDDSVLLCTNGLTDVVSDGDIADTLASRRTPQEQCDVLVDLAVTAGGTDNLTVVLLNYHIPQLHDD